MSDLDCLLQKGAAMKLGVVFQAGSMGARRYSCRLIEGLLDADSTVRVVLLVPADAGTEMEEFAAACHSRVEVNRFHAPATLSSIRWVRLLQKRFLRSVGRETAGRDLGLLNQCDVLFYPWPYGITPPEVSRPLVFIPHDLTYTRNFGSGTICTTGGYVWQRELHRQWLQRASCIVSAQYTQSEIHRVFGSEHRVSVIPLSRFTPCGRLPESEAADRVRRLGISGRYVLCINNLSPHKNLSQLLAGFALLKQALSDVKLVLVGYESDRVQGRADMTTGLALEEHLAAADVIGLGVVDDRDLVGLLQQAALLINPSLSEGNNGPGLDAWDIGTPVAMSEIPPFREHVEFLGIRAEMFDPRNATDICRAMRVLLANPELAAEMAEESRQAFQRYTWKTVATEYLQVFRGAAGGL